MARILVTEKIAETGLERLRDAGHEVVIRDGLSAEGLLNEIGTANALIIRSEVMPPSTRNVADARTSIAP